jgi:hypothetical protein
MLHFYICYLCKIIAMMYELHAYNKLSQIMSFNTTSRVFLGHLTHNRSTNNYTYSKVYEKR